MLHHRQAPSGIDTEPASDKVFLSSNFGGRGFFRLIIGSGVHYSHGGSGLGGGHMASPAQVTSPPDAPMHACTATGSEAGLLNKLLYVTCMRNTFLRRMRLI